MKQSNVFSVLSFGMLCISYVSAHGYLSQPAARNAKWRCGFNGAEPNYDLAGLAAGGPALVRGQNLGFSPCGDAANSDQFNHMEGGKYVVDETIVGEYKPNEAFEIKVEVTAHHYGHFEFFLCPMGVNSPNWNNEVSQECLNQHQLMRADGKGPKFFITQGETGTYTMQYIMPDVECERCVLQWYYQTANSGCNVNTEEFFNCADIRVKNSVQNPGTLETNPLQSTCHIGNEEANSADYGCYECPMQYTPGNDIFDPCSPSALGQSPAPSTQSPSTQSPSTQSPSTQSPSTQSPSTQSPSTQSPSTQSPSTQSGIEYEHILNWSVQKSYGFTTVFTSTTDCQDWSLELVFEVGQEISSFWSSKIDDPETLSNGKLMYLVHPESWNQQLYAHSQVSFGMNVDIVDSSIFNPDSLPIVRNFICYGSNSPSTQSPSTQSPSTQSPSTQSPSTQSPSTQSPSTQSPSTQSPSTQSPSTQSPSTQSPSTHAVSWDVFQCVYEENGPEESRLREIHEKLNQAIHDSGYSFGEQINKVEVAAFLGQIAHESDHLKAKREYCSLPEYGSWCLNSYDSHASWCTGISPAEGKHYYGRGWIQLTWDCNYHAAGEALNLPLLENPDLVEEDDNIAWQVSLWFWNANGVVTPARNGNFAKTTQIINSIECGGQNDKQTARASYYNKARGCLGLNEITDPSKLYC